VDKIYNYSLFFYEKLNYSTAFFAVIIIFSSIFAKQGNNKSTLCSSKLNMEGAIDPSLTKNYSGTQ
tara:strand:- start:367 stop:564 length:198 start_codon:yes stop_codon:yes gene_type:complete